MWRCRAPRAARRNATRPPRSPVAPVTAIVMAADRRIASVSRAFMDTCYRHPDRETGVSCSHCERPICPDCMTPTPVGMRCPECMRQKTKVVKGVGGGGGRLGAFPATIVLIAINVVAYLIEIAVGGGGLGIG